MHDHAQLLHRFYTAFQARDGATMASCYGPTATFSDPVFTSLKGEEVGAMWKMLTARADDLVIEFSGVEADDHAGRAHWEAWYTFSVTGRKVHNIIDATFTFEDGKIVGHTDVFGFYRWTRMALGVPGVLLGWTPLVQGKVRKQAMAGLRAWMAQDQK